MDPREAFALLQSASVRVAKEGSVDSVRGLREEVRRVVAQEDSGGGGSSDGWTSCVTHLKEYLLFPAILILKTRPTCGLSLEEEIASLIKIVVERSIVEDFKFFQEVFTQLFLLLTHRSSPNKVRETSEECKEVVLGAAACLLDGCGAEVRQHVYGEAFRPQLGHAIHLTLALATQEKSTAIKTQAIGTLGAMGQVGSFPGLIHSDQHLISTTFTNFLPGVSMGLTKVATAGDTQNHRVTAAAIDVWSHMVVMVMCDTYLIKKVPSYGESDTLRQLRTQLTSQQEKSGGRQQEEGGGRQQEGNRKGRRKGKFDLPEPEEEKECVRPVVSVEVTAEWVQQTAHRLQVLVESLSRLVSHSHWRVRLSLVNWAHHLLTHCSRSLNASVVVAVEVIAGLRSDGVEEVSSAAQEALLTLSCELHHPRQHLQTLQDSERLFQPSRGIEQHSDILPHPQTRQSLMEILEERIFALATQLPRVCRQQDDMRTLSMVRGLAGCMGVLGVRLEQVLASHSHLHRLLLALSYLLTLDTSHPHLLQEKTSDTDLTGETGAVPLPDKSFQHFRDCRVLAEVIGMCQLVGRHGDLVATVDLCLHLLHHTTHTRNETLLLLTLILKHGIVMKKESVDDQPEEDREHVVRSVMEAVVRPEVFDVSLYILPSSDAGAADSVTNDNLSDDTSRTASSLLAINKKGSESVGEVRSNVVQVWCALDMVAACARVLGAGFMSFLSSVLCQVMEKAGEANLLVANAAINTLKEIARATGHSTVGELIQGSVPHFWYPLSLRLKRLSQYPSAPLILEVCLQHAQLDVLAFTEELVGEVLASLDAYHTSSAHPLLRVLLVYVRAAARHEIAVTSAVGGGSHDINANISNGNHSMTESFNGASNMISRGTSDIHDQNIATNKNNSGGDHGTVAKFLSGYHLSHVRLKQCIDGSADMDEQEAEGGSASENFQSFVIQAKKDEKEMTGNVDNDYENEEQKKKVPRHIELVVEVLERCSHLMYLSERRCQLLLLEVVLGGCEALADWEDQRLPVLHKLWKPLMLRLHDKDSVVMGKVVEVVAAVVRTSGEFLRRRCLTQAFPPLLAFLGAQGLISQGRGKTSGYYLTPGYRTQLQILTRLPNMVKFLVPGPSQMTEVVGVVAIYCHTAQPTQLYYAALVLLTRLRHRYPHHVWLALTHLQAPSTITSPSHLLPPIKVLTSGPKELPKEVMDLYDQLC